MSPDEEIEQGLPLFVALQRTEQSAMSGQPIEPELAVRLLFDEEGAYLETTDSQGRPRPIDYRATRGPLQWLDYLHTHGLGGCLADDMGLGKTVQTIALLSRIYPAEKIPSLLVMPRSLLFNWQREIERFCPALRCAVYHGADRDLDEAMRSHLVLTTYGTLRGSIEQFVRPTGCARNSAVGFPEAPDRRSLFARGPSRSSGQLP